MQYRSYNVLDGTPNTPPEGVADGCYAFSPSCGTASSYVSVTDCVNEFDCHAPTKDHSTPLRSTRQRMNRPSDIHATRGVSYASASHLPPQAEGASQRLINASTGRDSRATHSTQTYGPIDDDVTYPATALVDPSCVTLSSGRLDSDSTCWLRGSPISSIRVGETAAHDPALMTGEHGHRYLSEGARVFCPSVSISGAAAFSAAAVTPLSSVSLSSMSLQARAEDTRRPPSSSSPMTTFGQTCDNDVTALRSHLSALLRQRAALPAFGTAAQHSDTAPETDSIRGLSSGPPPSSPLRRSGSDSGLQYAAVWPNQSPGRASHLQPRTSIGLERLSAGVPSAPTGRRTSSLSALSLVPEATPVRGRASGSFLRSVAAHPQPPSPSPMCPSDSATHVADTGLSSRASQDVRQARAQQAFDTLAKELTHELEEQLGLVFTLMRRVMIVDARAAAGQPSNTQDDRETLVGQLEESEDAAAHRALRFVELSSRHALEWINQGQYSAALELLQRADGLLQKDAGRLFRYLPDPVELGDPSISVVAGGRTDLRYSNGTAAPPQRPAAASAPAGSPDLRRSATFRVSDNGFDANHIGSDNTVRCMSVPFFSSSHEPHRLEAAAAVEHNFGVYHFKLGEYTLASARFARSVILEEELHAPGVGITYFNMAQAQHGLQQLNEALQYAVLAEEAVERQIFFIKDKATQMQRRLAQGRPLPAVSLSEGADAACRGGVNDSERDVAAAKAPVGGHRYRDAAATTHGEEEKALMRTWLQWRESVCFLSYVKQTHADWLDEMGLYKAAYHYYQAAHRWLLAVPRPAPEEQQRVRLLKEYMMTMKKRWRREEVEVELYQHPLRRSSTSTNGAVPTRLYPSRGTLSCASSKYCARRLQRPQLSAAALSAAVPIAKDFRSPLQSIIVTSVLPRAVEVSGRHPHCRSLAHGRADLPDPQEGSFDRPPASTSAPRPSKTAQARRRPSSASAALYSVYGPRRPSASLFPHRHSTDDHVTTTAEQGCPKPPTHSPPAQREPPLHGQQRGGGKPSWNSSTRVPIPPPSRRTSHRASNERDESAARGPLPRRSSVFLSHDSMGKAEVLTSAHLPPRPSPTLCSAHMPLTSQHYRSPPHDSAPASSTSAEVSVVRSLIFEVELGGPKPLPRHRSSEPLFLDMLSSKSMDKVAAGSPTHRCESPATPRGGSAGAGVSDLTTSISSAARSRSALTPSFSRIPGDLTWCVTVLQAFLRPRCRRQTLLNTEAERVRREHTAGEREIIQSHQRSCPIDASAVKFDAPSDAIDADRAGILNCNGTSSDRQPRLLPPKSATVPVVPQLELCVSQLSSVGLSSAVVSGAVGSVSRRTSAAQPSLSPSSSSSAAVAHESRVEVGASHFEAVAAGEEDTIANAHRAGEDLCADVAAVEHEPSTTPTRGKMDAGRHEGMGSDMVGESGEVAVAVLMERGESCIPYESNDEEATSGSAAEQPSRSKTPFSLYRDRFHDTSDRVDTDAPPVTSSDVIGCKYGGATSAAPAPSSVNHENGEAVKVHLRKPRMTDSAVVLPVEPLDSRRRSCTSMVVDALVEREESDRFVVASASTSKGSVHDSPEVEEGDACKLPSQLQASLATRWSRRMPSLSLRETKERVEGVGAEPAPAALLHSPHLEVLQRLHTTGQRADQADRPNFPGRDAASKAESGNLSEAAHPALCVRSRGGVVVDEAVVREATLSGLPPPTSASSADAENSCPSSVEDTVPPGGLSTRWSIPANPLQSTAEVCEAGQSIDSSASVYTVDLEVEDGGGLASGKVPEKAKEENGAADVLTATRGSPSVRSPEQLTTPVNKGDCAHQRSRAATLSPASSLLRSRGSSCSASSARTSTASGSHIEGADMQWPQDRTNAKTTAVERGSEESEAMEGAQPSEVVEITPRPPATQPPRRGRVFVFVPHKTATPAPTELTDVGFSVRSDDTKERIRFRTLAPPQSAVALDTEAVEDGVAKSMLRLAGGSRTSGSPDAPLSFNEEYCGCAAIEPYATTDDETLGRHTASIGSTTTQVTQLRESFLRSTDDCNEPRIGEGGPTVANVRGLLVKRVSVESAKATALGTAVVQDRIRQPSSSVELAEPIEAPVKVGDDQEKAADEDGKQVRTAPRDLSSAREIGIMEGADAPPQCMMGLTKAVNSLNSFMPPCLSLPLAPTEAAVAAVVPLEGPGGSNRGADLEIRPTAVSSSASLVPESPTGLPEMPEALAGMLSPQNPPLSGESVPPRSTRGGGDVDEALTHGEGGGPAHTEGGEVDEEDTSPPAKEVGDDKGCAYRNVWFSSEGARGAAVVSNQLSTNHSLPPRPPWVSLESKAQQQHHRHRAPSSGARQSPPPTQRPSANESTWSDMEAEEAQRRYISDQIVQEESATVIQQAWRDHVATRLRHQLYLLL